MNRYIYIGMYVENNKDTKIYYDKVLDKFYALPYDFFTKCMDNPDDLDESFSRFFPDIKDYELSNADEINALKIAVKSKPKEALPKKAEESSKSNKKSKTKPYKKALKGCIIALAACYIIYYACNHNLDKIVKDKVYETVECLENKEETKEKYLKEISDAIEIDSTIPDEFKQSWINDFTYLFNSDIFMTPFRAEDIISRIKEGDFSNVNKENNISYLSKIIFNDDYSIYLGLTSQLNDIANDKIASTNSNLFGYLCLGMEKDTLKPLLTFGADRYISLLAKNYGVTEDEIKEITDLLDDYYRSSANGDTEIYFAFNKKLGDILIRYYENKGKLSEYDQFVLVSDVFNRGIKSNADIYKTCNVDNNLFRNQVIFNMRDEQYGTYNLYFSKTTHRNITTEIYQDKLGELIQTKGDLDYSDPDARLLIYLYYLGYKDKFFLSEKESLFSSNPNELANYLMDSLFDNYDYVKMNPEFLYGYLTNGNINFEYLLKQTKSVRDDTLSVSILIEYERCLKEEVKAGKLSQEEFDTQYNDIFKILDYDPELAEFVAKAIANDESVFAEFRLPLTDINYASEDIKKYTYELEK